jgi:hypothetical protein
MTMDHVTFPRNSISISDAPSGSAVAPGANGPPAKRTSTNEVRLARSMIRSGLNTVATPPAHGTGGSSYPRPRSLTRSCGDVRTLIVRRHRQAVRRRADVGAADACDGVRCQGNAQETQNQKAKEGSAGPGEQYRVE